MATKKLDAASPEARKVSRGGNGQPAGGSQVTGMEDAGGGERVDQIRDILFGAQRQEYERRFARLEEMLVKNISDLNNEVTSKFNRFQNEYNQRLNQLEELLVKNISTLSADFDKKLIVQKKELQDLVLKNIANLSGEFTSKLNSHQTDNNERLTRLEELLVNNISGLSREFEHKLSSQKKDYDKNLQAVESQLSKSLADFKEDAWKQFNLQKNEFSEKLAALNEQLSGSVADLDHELKSSSFNLNKEISATKSEALNSLTKIDNAKVDRQVLAAFLHDIASGLEGRNPKSDTGKK